MLYKPDEFPERGKEGTIIPDYRDWRPLYEQVAEWFRELMFNGVLPQSSQFPLVYSLATEFFINPNTIQRAYGELEWQGYIYFIKGKGSFVADSSRLRAGMLGKWKARFKSLVSEGIKIGVTEGDTTGIIKKEYRKYMTERGERYD